MLACGMLVAAVAAHAQATANSGAGIEYKAVVRTPNGFLKSNAPVELRFGLYAMEVGEPNWVETHTTETDTSGVVTVRIGKGTKVSSATGVNAFNQLDFERQGRWLKVELKDAGTWKTISFEEFSSVPYAWFGWSYAYPPGIIMPFAGATSKIPAGWLLCDGTEYSRIEYRALYDAIGSNWGYNKSTGKFRVPDLRGYFLRGYVSGSTDRNSLYTGGNNSGVGSVQEDNFASHYHEFKDRNWLDNDVYHWGNNQQLVSDGLTNVSRTTGATGGSETRPRNVYVHYIIKY
jgi:microcystin-dependent protein